MNKIENEKQLEITKIWKSNFQASLSELLEKGDEGNPILFELNKTATEAIIKDLEIQISVYNGIPRRIRLDLNTVTELAIHNSIQEIEKMPADIRLSKAVVLMQEAKNLVADFIDEKL